jgi:hypothetical protein
LYREESEANMQATKCSEQGTTALEVTMAVSLAAMILVGSLVAATRYMSQRTLLGWSDVVVNDVRAAEAIGIARRGTVSVAFTPRSGSTRAAYTVTVGGTTVRRQQLPAELDVSAQTVQFSTLGVPVATSSVTVQLTDTALGSARTITIVPTTGAVSAQ